MEGKKILVLGGGVGGLATAHYLRLSLPSKHQIVVIEKDSAFYLCPFNTRIISGKMKHPREGERALSGLKSKGIEWIHGEILEIDSEQKTVRTSAGILKGDYLIIALGVEKVPSMIEGFAETAYNFYDAQGALELRQRLEGFQGGRIAILICSTTFACLATPYEVSLLIDFLLREKNVRQKTEIDIYSPETQPVPLAGPLMGQAICGVIGERGVKYHPQMHIKKIESHRLIFEEGEAFFDLLAGVPPHLAPPVVRQAGLTDETGWVPVDLQTLETKHLGVFAIGDVTSVQQPNPTGFFLPKNWVIADEEGRVVAKNIATQILGGQERIGFEGRSFCYFGVGGDKAMYAFSKFYAYPKPRVDLELASEQFYKERETLEQELVEKLLP